MIVIMLSILRILNILYTMFNPNRIWRLYGGDEAMKLLALGLLRYGKGLLCWYRVQFESQKEGLFGVLFCFLCLAHCF